MISARGLKLELSRAFSRLRCFNYEYAVITLPQTPHRNKFPDCLIYFRARIILDEIRARNRSINRP